jgi:hypothetical protein
VKIDCQKVKKEENRLKGCYKKLQGDTSKVLDGLIYRASFLRAVLENLEADIKENGTVEMFTQSDMVEPYQRKRPAIDIYNTTIKNYNIVIKLLNDALPKNQTTELKDDGFGAFVNGRDDV